MTNSSVDLSGGASVLSAHAEAPSSQASMILASKKLMKHAAAPLLKQMGMSRARTAPVQFLDSACGTGVVTQEVQGMLARDVLDKSTFICADSSRVLVDVVAGRIQDEAWVNTQAEVLDARDTGLEESSLSHVAVALGLHLIPEPDKVLKDCWRILKDGGVFGATTFPRGNGSKFWIPDMRAAFASLPFDAPFPEELPMQTHDSGRWYDCEWIRRHLEEEGFGDVQVTVTSGRYHVENAAEFVRFFGMMIPFIMNTWWSEELRREHPVDVVRKGVEEFVESRYEGKGWDVEWEIISTTGVVRK
ncbi:Glandicoline B O-methyltransferase roqN [Metarhizium brunneum]|uniref:Glandicoline B O-methyltransferase roqN n=1 Tax=Metarhizium brunneum TaxID=500148 RepID=A0A7D5Z0M3_9HYPO|nr:Glandicoline B O-methyltransferase roqN [Metarhizium brunneum]